MLLPTKVMCHRDDKWKIMIKQGDKTKIVRKI